MKQRFSYNESCTLHPYYIITVPRKTTRVIATQNDFKSSTSLWIEGVVRFGSGATCPGSRAIPQPVEVIMIEVVLPGAEAALKVTEVLRGTKAGGEDHVVDGDRALLRRTGYSFEVDLNDQQRKLPK